MQAARPNLRININVNIQDDVDWIHVSDDEGEEEQAPKVISNRPLLLLIPPETHPLIASQPAAPHRPRARRCRSTPRPRSSSSHICSRSRAQYSSRVRSCFFFRVLLLFFVLRARWLSHQVAFFVTIETPSSPFFSINSPPDLSSRLCRGNRQGRHPPPPNGRGRCVPAFITQSSVFSIRFYRTFKPPLTLCCYPHPSLFPTHESTNFHSPKKPMAPRPPRPRRCCCTTAWSSWPGSARGPAASSTRCVKATLFLSFCFFFPICLHLLPSISRHLSNIIPFSSIVLAIFFHFSSTFSSALGSGLVGAAPVRPQDDSHVRPGQAAAVRQGGAPKKSCMLV